MFPVTRHHTHSPRARRGFYSSGLPPSADRRRARPRLEALEQRDAPAALLGATQISYQDADGDSVLVTLSRPLLTATNVNAVFAFDAGSVNGDNSAGHSCGRST
jgi:hypothetical protein